MTLSMTVSVHRDLRSDDMPLDSNGWRPANLSTNARALNPMAQKPAYCRRLPIAAGNGCARAIFKQHPKQLLSEAKLALAE